MMIVMSSPEKPVDIKNEYDGTESPELQIVPPTPEEKQRDEIKSTWPVISELPDDDELPGEKMPNEEKKDILH